MFRHTVIYRESVLSPARLDRALDGLCRQSGTQNLLTATPGSALETMLASHAACQAGRRMVCHDPGWPEAWHADFMRAASVRHATQPDDLCLVLATSGSEARPKAIFLAADALARSAEAVCERLGLCPQDVWLCCMPLFHIAGQALLHRCQQSSASLLLHDRFDPVQVWRDLAHHRVTLISLVPSMLHRLLDVQEAPPPPSLRAALIGGAPLSATLARRALLAGWPLMPGYGMSEAASTIALCHTTRDHWQPGQAGAVLPHLDLRCDAEGRIHIRGDSLLSGHVDADGHYAPHPAGQWLGTGDYGRIDPEHGLIVEGRIDAAIVTGGEKVNPRQVEALLLRHPGVREVMVGGQPDDVWGQIVVAAYRGRVGEEALAQWCQQRLHGPLRPRRLIRLDALPMTASGKPDYCNLFSAGC